METSAENQAFMTRPVEAINHQLKGWTFVALRLFDKIEAAINPHNRFYRQDIAECGQQHVIGACFNLSDVWS